MSWNNFLRADEFCASVRDGTHDSPKPVIEGGKPLVTSKHIKGGNLDLKNSYNISEHDFGKINKRSLVEKWDVLISMIGTLGKVFFVDEEPTYAIKNIGLFKTKSETDGRWLYYYLKSPQARFFIDTNSQGSTQQYLSLKTLRGFPVLVPTAETEKKAICEILSSIDRKIELNQKMNQTLEEIAKAIFKSWFVDFDPVRAKAEGRPTGLPPEISDLFPDELMESEIGEMPKGWELKTLHDLLSTVSETYPLNAEDKVIFLNTGDIEAGVFLRNCYSPTDGLPGQAKKSIKQGDILFSEIRPKNKRYAFVDFDAKDYVVSTKLMVLRSKDSWNPYLPYFLITQDQTINYLQLLAEDRSGTFPQITYSQLGQVRFCLSTRRDLLEYFSNEILGSFYKKMSISRKENDTLSQLRDTLLPKLISGEFRIPDAEKFLEEAGV